MAQQNIPIIFQEKMNICQMGISSSDVKFGSVTLESSKYLCAKNTSGDKNSLNVIELDTRATSQFPFGGDSAINPPHRVDRSAYPHRPQASGQAAGRYPQV